MVLREDIDDNWLSAETDNSSNEAIAAQASVSNQNISIRKGVFSYMTKKPTSKMLIEAVRILSDDTRGASLPAITKWISGNYAVSDMDKLKLQTKKAVLKALKSGTIVRSETSKGSLGSNGSFLLGEVAKRKSAKAKNWTKKNPRKVNLNASDEI